MSYSSVLVHRHPEFQDNYAGQKYVRPSELLEALITGRRLPQNLESEMHIANLEGIPGITKRMEKRFSMCPRLRNVFFRNIIKPFSGSTITLKKIVHCGQRDSRQLWQRIGGCVLCSSIEVVHGVFNTCRSQIAVIQVARQFERVEKKSTITASKFANPLLSIWIF
jgi:hypothetical protein